MTTSTYAIDDMPIPRPVLTGRVITRAQLIHGTESGDLVVLMGTDWHATVHHNQNVHGPSYLSIAFFQSAREPATEEGHAAVTEISELTAATIEGAESIKLEGAPAIAIYEAGGEVRTVFVAGAEPMTIDIAFQYADGSTAA